MAAAGVDSQPRQTQVIEVAGRLDSDHAQQLLGRAEVALDRGFRQLVLDLSGVQFINGAGLRVLVEILRRVERRRRHLTVLNPSERVERVVAMVGLDDMLPIVSDPAARAKLQMAPLEVIYGA